jgi:hypothetical protein
MVSAQAKRVVLAVALAGLFGAPTLLEQTWRIPFAPIVVTVLNFPGIFCGLLFGGRFFPPEGYIGQSASRWLLMIAVQTVVWYVVLWLISLAGCATEETHFF